MSIEEINKEICKEFTSKNRCLKCWISTYICNSCEHETCEYHISDKTCCELGKQKICLDCTKKNVDKCQECNVEFCQNHGVEGEFGYLCVGCYERLKKEHEESYQKYVIDDPNVTLYPNM